MKTADDITHAEYVEREIDRLRDLLFLATEFRIPGSRIQVQWRGKEDWCVFEDGLVLNKAGDWEYEPLPSSRSEEFTQHTRFDRDTAIRLAKEKANEYAARDIRKRSA